MSLGIETAGLPLSGRGNSTCALTIPSIVSLSSPISRAAAKAASRSGPTSPVDPASARVWQTPHFLTNRVRLRAGSAVLVPQPETASTRAPSRAKTSSGRMSFEALRIGRQAGRSLYVEPALPRPVAGVDLTCLEAIDTRCETTCETAIGGGR